MNTLSSLLIFIGNKLGDTSMGTTASTITGAIHEHQEKITQTLDSLKTKAISVTPSSNVTISRMKATMSGKTVCFNGVFTVASAISTNSTVFNISDGVPGVTVDFCVFDTSSGLAYPLLVTSSGTINTVVKTLPSGTYRIAVTYQVV